MRFFPRAEFMPVFPPMDASTCANKVVGILTNLIPLLVMLDTKAVKSPTTPPPKAITQSDLLKLFFINSSVKKDATLIFFIFFF